MAFVASTMRRLKWTELKQRTCTNIIARRRLEVPSCSVAVSTTTTTNRPLSSYAGSGQGYPPPRQQQQYVGGRGYGPVRAYPTYTIADDKCVMTMKLMPPQFSLTQTRTLFLPYNKRGRLLMEFVPLSETREPSRDKDETLRFALSAEEVGFLLHQLPDHPVEFIRQTPKDYTMASSTADEESPKPSSIDNTDPLKVFRMTPGEAGVVTISVDYELNGVGGQHPPVGSATVPMTVTAQLGEVQVMREIMRSSIPVLTGWKTMSEICIERSFEANMWNNNPGRGGGGGGGYSNYSAPDGDYGGGGGGEQHGGGGRIS